MNYTFKTKEEYLAYRIMWKAEYRELSKTIREAVLARKRYQQAWSKAEKEAKIPGLDNRYNWKKIYDLHKEYLKNDEVYQAMWKKYNPSNYQYWCYPDRENLRKAAFAMLEELKLSKAEAQKQYEEENKLLTVS